MLRADTIAMSLPDINDDDIAAVTCVLRSRQLSLGPHLEQFESMLASRVGVKHGVGVSSGTAALHILTRALGLGPGDEVLVPSFTFASSVNCILYEGATPVFVDIEPTTYNLDPTDLQRKITERTRAIVVVDVFGHPAPWADIEKIAAQYGLSVIDDSCEALGACYREQPVGSFGNAATFAFYPNKQMTTGEGGMIVTNDDSLADICRSLRNQGRGKMGAWLEYERLGYNYRLDEMSAALGVSQLKRLDHFIERRAAVAAMYTERLQSIEWLAPPTPAPDVSMSWFVYVIRLAAGVPRQAIIDKLAASGIPTRAYFTPVHLQQYIREMTAQGHPIKNWQEGSLPVTERIGRQTLALPFHSQLTEEEVDFVVRTLRSL